MEKHNFVDSESCINNSMCWWQVLYCLCAIPFL